MQAQAADPPVRRGPEVAVLAIVFLLTRAALAYLAAAPDVYQGLGGVTVIGDVNLYASYAEPLLDGQAPYAEVAIEYPPGALPALVLPALLAPALPGATGDYQAGFFALAAVLDGAGLVGLWLLARRWGSTTGAWLWVLGMPLLGPITYSRLDLLPAVMTIWALERAAAGRWFASGGWLGAGALVKFYPGLLALPALLASRRPRLAVGAVVWSTAPLLLVAGVIPEMLRIVLGYHTSRGIQVESVWATPLLIAQRFGVDVTVPFQFGSFQVDATAAGAVKSVATLAAVAALLGGTWLAARAGRAAGEDQDRVAQATAASVATTIVLLLATGSVFSPQYVLWPLGVGAAVLCAPRSPLLRPLVLLLPVAALTQGVFPVLYQGLLRFETLPLAVLTLRNLLVVAMAAWMVTALWRATRPGHVAEQQDVPHDRDAAELTSGAPASP